MTSFPSPARTPAAIRTAQGSMNDRVCQMIREELAQGAVTDRIHKVIRDEQRRWLAATVSTSIGLVCAGFPIFNSEPMVAFLNDHDGWLGPITAVAAFFFTWLLLKHH